MHAVMIRGAAAAAVFASAVGAAHAGGSVWSTVVNNGQLMPNSTKFFNSYNQPSLNERGLVAFRARSKGPQQPTRGIYTVDLLDPMRPVGFVADVDSEVPDPNNIEYPPGSGVLATFQEFPSFPRIDRGSDLIATRGQSQPVWNYLLPDGTETSVGTSGCYATVGGALVTGASQLGAVADAKSGELVFPWWQVPGTPAGTRFDQFPGAPAAFDGHMIAFKGNYTDPVAAIGRTGVFVRDLTAQGGQSPVVLIANSLMTIPGQDPGAKMPVLFGSTAPPSGGAGRLVFVGLDSEEAPTMGGIYLADAVEGATLVPLVEIGDQVPGEPAEADEGATFTRIGEALSFDGRWLAFWAAWGSETRERLLLCPVDGNADVIAACNEMHPDGYLAQVPVHQGIFAYDTWSGRLSTIAKTSDDEKEGFADFVFWNFSGSPGTGGDEGGDQEPPRWRSTSFVAIDGMDQGAFRAVFKARLADGTDAIMLRVGPGETPAAVLVSTETAGVELDADAPAGSLVTAVGIERDGLRNGRLALVASMLDAATSESWAGIYAADLPPVPSCTGDANGDGAVDGVDLATVLDAWGPCAGCSADVYPDGKVDALDILQVLSCWGGCLR